MPIRFFEPLSRAFNRMRRALFGPFDLRKWFVVGFTAFLAGLTDCHGNGGGGGKHTGGRSDLEELIYFPRHAMEWLNAHPIWFTAIILGVILIFILVILLTWLSSRGKFMFLDNVVHDRAQVAKPWYELRSEGNSLFFWNISVGLFVFLIIGSLLVYGYSIILNVYEHSGDLTELIVPVIIIGLGLIKIFLLAGFVNLMVVDFVVPIMYRSRIGVLAALRDFLPLFGSHVLLFIGYGLFTFVLWILIVIGIILVAVLTCCIGFLFLIIPYINAVVLLPISYTMRAFSLEFLEQFGPAYQLFPREKPGSATQGLPQS